MRSVWAMLSLEQQGNRKAFSSEARGYLVELMKGIYVEEGGKIRKLSAAKMAADTSEFCCEKCDSLIISILEGAAMWLRLSYRF